MQPTHSFLKVNIDEAIERATVGSFRDIKILRHALLGHLGGDVLELRLKQHGEFDMNHLTASFGNLFQ